MAKEKYYEFDKYVKEAHVEPFNLRVDEKNVITIENPSGIQLIRLHEAGREGDVQAMLWALCGEQWPKVEALLVKAGHGAMDHLLDDMMVHFGMSEEVTLVGPGGGEVKEHRRSKVTRLMKMGYKVKGEV